MKMGGFLFDFFLVRKDKLVDREILSLQNEIKQASYVNFLPNIGKCSSIFLSGFLCFPDFNFANQYEGPE